MRTLLTILLFSSSFATANPSIPLTDVASAFAWLKIEPEFPIVLNSDSANQISFRVLDDVYTLSAQDQNFKIVKTNRGMSSEPLEESINLDAMTVEKILKFVQAKTRDDASLSQDTFNHSVKALKPVSGFQSSQSIYQCKSDLPSRITKNGSVVNEILQHTWIQNGASESFGMPNTDDAGYFGGVAHIRTPDSFIGKGPKRLECSPVLIPSDQNEVKVSARALCVAKRLSLSQNPIFENTMTDQTWIAHFDYNALEHNCLVAVRFVLECSGAQAPLVVNAGIGGKLKFSDIYSVSDYPAEVKSQVMELRSQLAEIRREESISNLPAQAEQLMNEALNLDSRIRGVVGPSAQKSLRDICDRALQSCPL